MKGAPEIVKLMTPFPHTITISEDLAAAQRMLAEHDISHLPVTRDGELAGIITRRDVELGLQFNKRIPTADQLGVSDLCSLDVLVVESSELITNVLVRMREKTLDSVLVAKKGRLVGIVSPADFHELLLRNLLGKGWSDEPPDITA